MRYGKFFILLVTGAQLLAACYKDKGNYIYDTPERPVVSNLDSVYVVRVGDSLTIAPEISITGNIALEYEWRISDPEAETPLVYKGNPLKMLFGLRARNYLTRLTITNPENGMKYFYTFTLRGITEFDTGVVVLSEENGVSQLSFVQPDGTVQARVYNAINGEDLPPEPQQLLTLYNLNYTPPNPLGYWVLSRYGGVKLDVATLVKDRTLKENFFSEPESMDVGEAVTLREGAPVAVINGLMYAGTTYTWDQSPTYGMFGLSAGTDYEMAPSFIFNSTQGYFIGFERNRKQFLRFNNYGTPTYFGPAYAVTSSVFNPLAVGMDLIVMKQVNGADCYAFCRDASGDVYELRFSVEFAGPFNFNPLHKRLFVRQDVVTAESKWEVTQSGIFYITSGSKIFRYNPVNQDIRELTTSFDGKKVTMIRLADENTLVAGAEGSLYYLDIRTGRYGDLLKQTEGIPGNPVDIVIKQ